MAADEATPAKGGKVVVCTFATPEYEGSASLLRHTALREGEADAVVVYTPRDVAAWFARHPDIPTRARGYGYWSWKPWCIRRALAEASPRDVVVWCDAGVMLRQSLRPYARVVEHVLLFRLAPAAEDRTNATWTKPAAFEAMGRDTPRHRAATQCNAALQVYRNTPEALAFLDEYERWCGRLDVVGD